MRPVLSIASAAGIAVAALTAAAAPAFAAPPPTLVSDDGGGKGGGRGSGANVRLQPSTVHPGDTVTIQLDCSAYSSPAPTWRSATAFDGPVDLQPMNGQPGFFSGSATISSTLQSGSYSVTGACASGDSNSGFEGRLTITATDDGYTMPQGTARTGLGGSITGGDTTQVALGAALVAGAGGLVLRRRRSNDGG